MDLRPHAADHSLTNGRWTPPKPDVRDYNAPVTGEHPEPFTPEAQIARQRREYRRYLIDRVTR